MFIFLVILEPLSQVKVQRIFEIGSFLKKLLASADVMHHAAWSPRVDLKVTVETLVRLWGRPLSQPRTSPNSGVSLADLHSHVEIDQFDDHLIQLIVLAYYQIVRLQVTMAYVPIV